MSLELPSGGRWSGSPEQADWGGRALLGASKASRTLTDVGQTCQWLVWHSLCPFRASRAALPKCALLMENGEWLFLDPAE